MSSEFVFHGGAVFTGAGAPLNGHAVIVCDRRIAAVVPESEAAERAAADATWIDLDGALLSPGFQDAHIHAVGGGIELLQCNLTEADDAEQTVELIRAYATANPDEEWILGGGWSMDSFPGGNPPRGVLDEAAGGRPVLLQSRDHHSTWASTAAIQRAGITGDTPDPEDGRIVREADGFPAGTFHEGAGDLFAAVRPATSDELAYQGLLRAQDELIALGITGWQDAMVAAESGGITDPLPAYERAAADGRLLVHVVGAQWWMRDGGIDQVARMADRRARAASEYPDRRIDLGTTKIMVDGVAENQTAAMLTPYRDASGHDTCNHGLSFIEPQKLREYVTALDHAGQQVHMHALGDRAVREALDALQTARDANGHTDGRHHLAHLQVVAASDVARFASLDAIANIQALWATHEDQLDELTLPFLQDGQVDRQYPFGDLVREDVRLAAGSDWPVSTADPLAAIHVAVNRTYPGSVHPPLGGEQQRLDLETALAAYTSGSAYVNRRDGDTGSIREGYLANLVVIEPNPFRLLSADLHTARVTSTWIEGRLVYSASEIASVPALPDTHRKESR